MLKYLYCKEVFKEVPDEITLGISISGCQIRCKGCHSKELWEDNGILLTVEELKKLIEKHEGVTCICFFGGEHDINALSGLIAYVKHHTQLKTAWYCGLDMIPPEHQDVMTNLDYIKIGHYDEKLGGLDSPITNQRLYKIEHKDNTHIEITGITYLLTGKT